MPKLFALAAASALLLAGCGAPQSVGSPQDADFERLSLMEEMMDRPPMTRLPF